MSIGQTDEALTDALAEDLRGVLSWIPSGERTLERFRSEVLGYFERPDHLAVEVTSGLVDDTAPERGRKLLEATIRPVTAWGAIQLERHRRATEDLLAKS